MLRGNLRARHPIAIAAIAAALAAGAAAQHRASSGLDPATFDRTVRPQDDLYQYVNGGWLADTEIPGDRVSYGALAELGDRVERDLNSLILELVEEPRAPGSPERQIADLYRSMVDVDTVNARGVEPARPVLDRLRAIATPEALAAEVGYLSSIAMGGPFHGTLAQDASDRARLVVYLSQGGTLLPDRDYYLVSTPEFEAARAGYRAYIERVLSLASWPDPASAADAVLTLETSFAWSQEPTATARLATGGRLFTLDHLERELPGFAWRAWAKPQGLDRAAHLVLRQPGFFGAFARLAATEPLDTWKAWLAVRFLTAAAPYLSTAFGDARFDFFGTALTGQEQPRERWKRGVSMVNAFLPDALGRIYVERHFPRASRERARRIVDGVVRAYRDAVRESEWLTPQARTVALEKLAGLTTRIGYPDRWRSYAGLDIRPDDLLGNVERARRYEAAAALAGMLRSGPMGEWLIPPQMVNAYYRPAFNEIALPAAILQPPFFDPDADEAVNYGGIGAVVGHEIGHALDERGRRYDAAGAARDWWTPDDETAFHRLTERLVAQYGGYTVGDGLRIDGRLTLTENIGDLGGLAIAYRAWRQSLGGRPAAVIDGFTGDQRFFLGWAQMWRFKIRDEYVRNWLLTSPHALPRYRTNGPASNLPAFYGAFDVGPGDGLYREPDRRVRIW